MKLTYRGIEYNYNPPQVETTVGRKAGKYRGKDWRFCNLKKSPVLQPTHNLTYRGVKYTNHPVAATEATTPNAVANKARILMQEQERTVLKRQQSMLSRLTEEVGLDNSSESYHHA
ncbi:MAG: DUF4278 domain-containing protein [Microcoleaceae cyanobacterium]